MIIRIDGNSTVPPYDQIREQIETMAISGVLASGTRLPSIRQLAVDLGLAPATVARAFTALEHSGVVASHRGKGTTVVGPGHRPKAQKAQTELRAAAEAFARRAQQLGVSRRSALDAASRSLKTLPDT